MRLAVRTIILVAVSRCPLTDTIVAMDAILGQKSAIQWLAASLDHGRLPHACIFYGPRGVGKFTTAVALARMILCQDRPQRGGEGLEACGACDSCGLLKPRAEGNGSEPWAHPDLHVLTKEMAAVSSNPALRRRKQMNIPIDLLRERLLGGKSGDDKVRSAPVYQSARLGHGKVFVIDEAELLDAPGQNALLKVLEEPPKDTYLILISCREDQLLTTIRSRCQRVAFHRLAETTVEKWLNDRHPQIPDDQRRWLVDFAEGSLGQAKLAAEYHLFEWAEAILTKVDAMRSGRYPADLGATIAQCVDAFAKAWVDRHENASKDAANKLAARLMLSMIAQHARRKIVASTQDATPGDHDATERLVGPWLKAIDVIEQAHREFLANVNLALVADHLAMMLSQALTGSGDLPTLTSPAGRRFMLVGS